MASIFNSLLVRRGGRDTGMAWLGSTPLGIGVVLGLAVSHCGAQQSAAAPPNDSFELRSTLSGTTNSVLASNVGATTEAGEPAHAGDAGGSSVWWSWTAPNSGTFSISTVGSSFDT